MRKKNHPQTKCKKERQRIHHILKFCTKRVFSSLLPYCMYMWQIIIEYFHFFYVIIRKRKTDWEKKGSKPHKRFHSSWIIQWRKIFFLNQKMRTKNPFVTAAIEYFRHIKNERKSELVNYSAHSILYMLL